MRRICWIGAVAIGCLCLAVAGAAEPSVAEWLGRLSADRELVRLEAIDHLGLQGEKAAEAVPALTRLLQHSSPAIRAHAAHALGQIGSPARTAVPALVRLAGDPEHVVRRAAIAALGQIRPGPRVTVPLFARAMEDADPAARHRALHALAEAGEQAVPFLIQAVKNEKAAYWACLVLSEIGPAAKEAVPALTELLSDKRPEVRREAILALAEIGEAAAPVVPQLVKALDDEWVRTAATFALGRIGNIPPAAEKKIRENANSTDKILKITSIWAIAITHREDRKLLHQTTEQLIDGLKDTDPRVRGAAAQAMAALRPGPEISAPLFEKALKGADEQVVRDALGALAGLGPRAVPALIEALKHEKLRAYVAYVLGQVGPEAAPAAEALVKLLDNKDPDARQEALIALAKIGPAAKAAVPGLTRYFEAHQAEEAPACYGAAFALGKIGPAAIDAKPALRKAIVGKDESLALISAWALTQIHPECEDCLATSLPVLIRGLSDPAPKFRQGAADALGKLGPRAKAALPALKKAAADEDATVRQAAAAALKAIGG